MGEVETLTYWELKKLGATDEELQELKGIEARYSSGEMRLGAAFEQTEELRAKVMSRKMKRDENNI